MFQVVGFDEEEQRRWWQVAVKRREMVCGPLVRETVVGGAEAEEEEGVSVVPAVKGAEHIVVGSHPAQKKSSTWCLVETGTMRH